MAAQIKLIYLRFILSLLGNVEDADIEKQRLEQRQRDYRKKLEAEGKQFEPRWFTPAEAEFDEDSNDTENSGMTWKYNGKYWTTRESHDWPSDLLQLW